MDGESHEFAEDDPASTVHMDQVHRQTDNGSSSNDWLLLMVVGFTTVDENDIGVGEDVAVELLSLLRSRLLSRLRFVVSKTSNM